MIGERKLKKSELTCITNNGTQSKYFVNEVSVPNSLFIKSRLKFATKIKVILSAVYYQARQLGPLETPGKVSRDKQGQPNLD